MLLDKNLIKQAECLQKRRGTRYAIANLAPAGVGSFSVGYGNFRIGENSERIRNEFQNELAHNKIKPQPYFKVLNDDRYLYYNWGTTSNYTLW